MGDEWSNDRNSPVANPLAAFEWSTDPINVSILWEQQSDEWLVHLAGCLEELSNGSLTVGGHLYDATTQPFIRINLAHEGQSAEYAIWIAPLQIGGLLLIFAGNESIEKVP